MDVEWVRADIGKIHNIGRTLPSSLDPSSWIVSVAWTERSPIPYFNCFVFGTSYKESSIKFQIQHRLPMSLVDPFEELACWISPNKDICVTTSWHDDILMLAVVELEAQNRCWMAGHWFTNKSLCLQIPFSKRPVSTATYKESADILDGIYTFSMCLLGVVLVRQLKARVCASVPIFLQLSSLLV